MPIYEYQCRSCGHRTEALQRMSDPPLTTCGECGGELKRLISSPSFQFKGSGWYVTDYARAGAGGDPKDKAEASQKNGSEAAKGSTDAGKAETGKSAAGGAAEAKPAAKPGSGGGSGSPSD